MEGCFTCAQVRHAAPVAFLVDFDGDKHVYVFNSGSESLDKHEPRDILHCHVERRDTSFAVAERAE
jgi:hypothetical protein